MNKILRIRIVLFVLFFVFVVSHGNIIKADVGPNCSMWNPNTNQLDPVNGTGIYSTTQPCDGYPTSSIVTAFCGDYGYTGYNPLAQCDYMKTVTSTKTGSCPYVVNPNPTGPNPNACISCNVSDINWSQCTAPVATYTFIGLHRGPCDSATCGANTNQCTVFGCVDTYLLRDLNIQVIKGTITNDQFMDNNGNIYSSSQWDYLNTNICSSVPILSKLHTPQCSGQCGNGICQPSEGEDVNSCSADCTPPSTPGTPTGLTVSPSTTPSSCGNNWMNVSWNSVSGATSYQVYRDGGATAVYNGALTSFSDTGLVLGSTHSYTVKASNSVGSSALSSSVSNSVAPACGTPPPTPATLTGTAISCSTGQITLTWSSSASATSYTLKRAGTTIYTGPNTTFTDSGLTANTTYSYTVSATNASGTSADKSATATAPASCSCVTMTYNSSNTGFSLSSGGPIVTTGFTVDQTQTFYTFLNWGAFGGTRPPDSLWFNSAPAGLSCGSPSAISASTVRFTCLVTTTNPGTYTLTGGTHTGTTDNTCADSRTIGTNITVTGTAQYTLTVNKTYGGTVTSNDGNINCGLYCSKTYPANTNVTLTATPVSSQWKFVGWTGSCTGSSLCSMTVNAAKTVSAIFTPKPLIYKEF